MTEDADADAERAETLDEEEFERRWRQIEQYQQLREEMIEAGLLARGAWKRYLSEPRAELRRGYDLFDAYRWMHKHVRLADPERHARLGGQPSADDLLPPEIIRAIEDCLAKVAEGLLQLDSVTGSSGSDQLRQALGMDGRDRGPKKSKSEAVRSTAVGLTADILGRMVRRQRRFLDRNRGLHPGESHHITSAALPELRTIAEVYERVGYACAMSAASVRAWWTDEIKRDERGDWRALFEEVEELIPQVTKRVEELSFDPEHTGSHGSIEDDRKRSQHVPGRAQFKQAIDKDFRRK
ncbi:MAG TPA: hypothetical protein VF457_06095 [Burkholderiaceae bacterium]